MSESRQSSVEVAERDISHHGPGNQRRRGVTCAIISAIAYMGASLALRDVARQSDPAWAVWVSFNKAVPAAAVSWFLVLRRAFRGADAFPPRRIVGALLLTGLFMQFGGNVAFQWSLALAGLAFTVPLTFASLILSGAAIGRVLLNERVTRRTAIAMGTLVLAIVLLSLSRPIANSGSEDATHRAALGGWAIAVSVALAACAGLAYASSSVAIRRTVTRDVPLSATLVLLSSSGVVGLGLTSLWSPGWDRIAATTAREFATMMTAGVCNAVAFYALSESLRHISVTHCNLLNASQITMAAIAGVGLFGEPITLGLVAGTLLTVGGLMTMDDRRAKRSDAHGTSAADEAGGHPAVGPSESTP